MLTSHGSARVYIEALTQGVALMRASEFFEAHERFESGFRACSGRARRVLHGLAQWAASHHQLSLGRARASASTWRKARDKLHAEGALSDELDRAMHDFHAQLGITEHGPRFVALTALPPAHVWPVPRDPRTAKS